MTILHGGTASAAIVLPSNTFITNNSTGTCYSGLKIGSDGNLYERQAAGGWSRFGTWLFIGTAANYYVQRTVTSGSLTTDAGGPVGSGLQLNADRIYDIQISYGEKLATVKFEIATESAGTTIVASNSYSFVASSVV